MKKNNPEILVFNPNDVDFFLTILIIILNGIATVNILGEMEYTYRIFTFVMYTIFVTLVLFLIASKIKVYEKKYSYHLLVITIIQFARLFFLPQVSNIVFPIICIVLSIIIGVYTSIDGYFKSISRSRFLSNKEQNNAQFTN